MDEQTQQKKADSLREVSKQLDCIILKAPLSIGKEGTLSEWIEWVQQASNIFWKLPQLRYIDCSDEFKETCSMMTSLWFSIKTRSDQSPRASLFIQKSRCLHNSLHKLKNKAVSIYERPRMYPTPKHAAQLKFFDWLPEGMKETLHNAQKCSNEENPWLVSIQEAMNYIPSYKHREVKHNLEYALTQYLLDQARHSEGVDPSSQKVKTQIRERVEYFVSTI